MRRYQEDRFFQFCYDSARPYLSNSVPHWAQVHPPHNACFRLAGFLVVGAGVPQVGQLTGLALIPHLP